MVRKKRMKRSRGLSFEDADEVIDKFSKVAVVKQRVSAQEQVRAITIEVAWHFDTSFSLCPDNHR